MAERKYADSHYYENKLARVMARFGVEDYDFALTRYGGWVEFRYKGEVYRFEHDIKNAEAHGQKIRTGSDAFAQLVMALEDLARIVDRGIYDLSHWVVGMKALPAAVDIPPCLRLLGFDRVPSVDELKSAYRSRLKLLHPDNPDTGSREEFDALQSAYAAALRWLGENA